MSRLTLLSVLQKKNDCSSCAHAKERGRGGRMTSTSTHEERSIWAKITKLLELVASRQTSSETEAGARNKRNCRPGNRTHDLTTDLSLLVHQSSGRPAMCRTSKPVAIGAFFFSPLQSRLRRAWDDSPITIRICSACKAARCRLVCLILIACMQSL